MSEFKGTPGPWGYDSELGGIYGDKCSFVCDVSDNKNANLIAAAPELLEALQDMLSGWEYIRHTHGDLYGVGWDRSENKAVLAINKALGMENNQMKNAGKCLHVDTDLITEKTVSEANSQLEKTTLPVIEEESTSSATIDSAQQNDRLVKVMRSLAFSFPDERYSDIEEAAKRALAAMELV